MYEETKKCPYCGEEVMADAKKCKHCGEWLDEQLRRINQAPNKKAPSIGRGILGGFIASLIVVVLVAFFASASELEEELSSTGEIIAIIAFIALIFCSGPVIGLLVRRFGRGNTDGFGIIAAVFALLTFIYVLLMFDLEDINFKTVIAGIVYMSWSFHYATKALPYWLARFADKNTIYTGEDENE